MAIIAARKPYYIEQSTTSLQVQIRSWAAFDLGEWQHTIEKTTTEEGVAQDLKIDVSPYIRPYFENAPSNTPTNTGGIKTGNWLNVIIEVNGVEEQHNAVNGYISPIDEAYYDRWQAVRSIHATSDSMLTLPGGTYMVNWSTDDGQVASESIDSTVPYMVRVAHTSLDLTTSHRLTIDTGLYQYKFNVVCPYMDGTLGFVNAKGLWEYFDINGRQDYNYTKEGTRYIPWSTGEVREIQVNGTRTVRVNTGWVDYEFQRIMDELQMSEYHVWHKGTSWDNLVFDSNSIRKQERRADKLINYTFEYTYAAPRIPIV